MYIYIYIYVYSVYTGPSPLLLPFNICLLQNICYMPSPPTKSFPIKSPRVKLSGRLPIKLYGHENSHPLELRVCLSQTLRNPNS